MGGGGRSITGEVRLHPPPYDRASFLDGGAGGGARQRDRFAGSERSHVSAGCARDSEDLMTMEANGTEREAILSGSEPGTTSFGLPAEDTRRWHVLHTRSRQEKVLASGLLGMGLHCYLPLVQRVHYYGLRKVRAEVPLFPSYLFLFGTLEDAYRADRTRRVAGIIPVVDQEHIEWELANIRLALSRGADLAPHSFLERGIRVEVRAGPFKGLQGLVESSKKRDRVILQVRAFGKAARLEVDGSILEAID